MSQNGIANWLKTALLKAFFGKFATSTSNFVSVVYIGSEIGLVILLKRMKISSNHIIKFFSTIVLVLVLSINSAESQIIYYSKTSGHANLVATWGTNTDGSGTSPANFITGDVFIVRSGSALTTSAGWTIDDGAVLGGGQLIINGGGKLTASHVVSFVGTETVFQMDASSRYTHNTGANLGLVASILRSPAILNIDAASNFEISASGVHTTLGGAIFGNFEVSGANVVASFRLSAALNIQNVLTVNNTCTLWLRGNSSIVGNPSATGTGTLRVTSSNAGNLPSGKSWMLPVLFDTSASQTIPSGTYSDLNATGGNRTVVASANIILTGSFTPGAGIYTIGTGATFEYNINGSLSIPIINYQNLTISGTGTKTIASPLTVNGTLAVTNSNGFLSINGQTLTLNGNTDLVNGRLIGSATSNLTIGGITSNIAGIRFNQTSTDNQINTFTLNRTGGGGATLLNNVDIINSLILTNGVLRTDNNVLALRSTSISGTARVHPVGSGSSITYGSIGGIRAERFIPASFRSYRDLSPSIYTNSSFIFENWQESATNTAGFGTHITGVAGVAGNDATTGLDRTQTGNIAMFTYNGTTYPSVTNTKNTRLDPYRGYRILIRGDRNVALFQTPTPTTMNTATVLRATGQMIYGDITYSTSGVTNGVYNSSYALNSSSATGFSLIGNPYLCPISWGGILGNVSTTNILPTYWYFDPQQGVNGIYATWLNTGGETGTSNGVGNTNNFIQPGQAIFVRNNSSTSPTVRISETNKSTGSALINVFSTPPNNAPLNKLGLVLQKYVASRNGLVVLDGVTLVFGENKSNNVLPTEDAGKISNGSENMALVNTSAGTPVLLSIESRKTFTKNDTIPIRLWQVVSNDAYTLNLMPKQFATNGKMVFLNDRFLNKQTFIRTDLDTLKLNFTSNRNDSASYYNRFSIIAKTPFPITNNKETVQLTGTLIGKPIALNWKAFNSEKNLFYDLEKSSNGIEFTTVSRTYADGTSTQYNQIDSTPVNGKNYYRIRTYTQEAAFFMSNTVVLENDNNIDFLSVYPNPVTGNTVNIQMNKLAAGKYQVSIVNNNGKTVFTKQISHNGQSTTAPIVFNQNFANGLYSLLLMNMETNKKYTRKLFIAKQ